METHSHVVTLIHPCRSRTLGGKQLMGSVMKHVHPLFVKLDQVMEFGKEFCFWAIGALVSKHRRAHCHRHVKAWDTGGLAYDMVTFL